MANNRLDRRSIKMNQKSIRFCIGRLMIDCHDKIVYFEPVYTELKIPISQAIWQEIWYTIRNEIHNDVYNKLINRSAQ